MCWWSLLFFRVRKLSEMTEQMSQSLLDTVISVTGSMAAPLLRSKQGRGFLATVPGEVVLASLDAISECPAADAFHAHCQTGKIG